jgi:tRNA (cmo5U34)-methyltransferase
VKINKDHIILNKVRVIIWIYKPPELNVDRWRTENLTSTYLKGVRGAIPMANEQIEILLRIITKFKPHFNSFLDIGCGDGILGRTLFSTRPDSKGIFLDFSEPMIAEAKLKCTDHKNPASFIIQDFRSDKWMEAFSNDLPLDLVVSGFSLHHLDDNNKKRIYSDIFDKILKSGGLFLNLDAVALPTKDIEEIFDDYFLENLERYNKKSNSDFLMKKIENEYYKGKAADILAPVEDQCAWLRDIGFHNVDCYFKVFELAVFGGIKPG